MADLKTTQLTALSAAPATNDLLAIVDVSDTTMAASGTNKKIVAAYFANTDGTDAKITGGGTVALGGNTLTVGASGTAILNAGTAIVSAIGSGATGSVADDNAYSFTPSNNQGMLMIWAEASGGVSSTRSAIINYRAAATPYCAILVQGGTAFEAGTVALNGTTGTDAKVTVAAANDGKIYIENRSGVSLNHSYFLIGV